MSKYFKINSIFKGITLKNSALKIITLIALLASGPISFASNTQYLPIKMDPLIELELDRLATLAKMPVIEKPFHIATILLYLEEVQDTHPVLYSRIKRYIERYRDDAGITHVDFELSYSDNKNKSLPNQRGRTSESNFKAELAGYFHLSENFSFNFGGTVYDLDGEVELIPNHSYISYYHDYFQIDVGYKEIWYGPLYESANLLSTNAEPMAQFSISSPRPLTDYKFEYAATFGKFETMDGIRFEDTRSSGEPGFVSVYVGAQFLEWWTLAINRTMMFGGGDRLDVGLGDVWDALIDPVNSDNCGGESELQDCTKELGNQQISVNSKFDFYWGMPVQIFFEYAGEDGSNFKWYGIGNRAETLGVFLPYLTEKSSLVFEYQIMQNAWYVHSIYDEAFRNNMDVIGHWWGDEKLIDDVIGVRILNLRYSHEISDSLFIDAKFSTLDNASIGGESDADESIYDRGNELTLGLNHKTKGGYWRYELYAGNTVLGDDFTRFSVKYTWD